MRIAPDRGKLGWKEISSPQVCCWLLGSHQELQELCHLSSCELRVTCKAQPGAAGASASRVLALLCRGQDLFWSSGRAGVGFAVGFVCVRWGYRSQAAPGLIFLQPVPAHCFSRLQQTCLTLLLYSDAPTGAVCSAWPLNNVLAGR